MATTRSQVSSTWCMLCEMKMPVMPCAESPRTKPSTLSVSFTERWLVGSSRMSRRDLKCMARAMATPWRCPPDSSPTSASAERRCRSTSRSAATASSRILGWSITPTPNAPNLNGSRPMNRLRAIDMVGTMELYWWIVSMPSRMARLGLPMRTCSPSISIVPSSGLSTPARILMRVDLPAPLSPTRPRTSPRWMSRSIPLSA